MVLQEDCKTQVLEGISLVQDISFLPPYRRKVLISLWCIPSVDLSSYHIDKYFVHSVFDMASQMFLLSYSSLILLF